VVARPGFKTAFQGRVGNGYFPQVSEPEAGRLTRRNRGSAVPSGDRVAPPSAIVTIRRRKHAMLEDLTPEEHQRRGDAADALFRELVRRITETT
jgi:hypothetical protein